MCLAFHPYTVILPALAGDPVEAAEEMRSVVKALPEGDAKANHDCPICMNAVAVGAWQVRAIR